jgi:hypothetical protein
MDHADRQCAQHQAVGRFQSQQAAADDHGVFVSAWRQSSRWCRRCRGRQSRLPGLCRAAAG